MNHLTAVVLSHFGLIFIKGDKLNCVHRTIYFIEVIMLLNCYNYNVEPRNNLTR
jgi:hypothetical protein